LCFDSNEPLFNSEISNFMKIRPVGGELLHQDEQTHGRTDGRKERQTDMTKLIDASCNFANAYVPSFTYLRTYLLTPWCRVLLEKLTGLQLVNKFPSFHGTRRFITALTSVRHPSLSWVSPIQSIYPHPTSWRSILILSTHLRLGLPSGLFPSGFPTKTLYTPLLTHTRHMPSPSHSS